MIHLPAIAALAHHKSPFAHSALSASSSSSSILSCCSRSGMQRYNPVPEEAPQQQVRDNAMGILTRLDVGLEPRPRAAGAGADWTQLPQYAQPQPQHPHPHSQHHQLPPPPPPLLPPPSQPHPTAAYPTPISSVPHPSHPPPPPAYSAPAPLPAYPYPLPSASYAPAPPSPPRTLTPQPDLPSDLAQLASSLACYLWFAPELHPLPPLCRPRSRRVGRCPALDSPNPAAHLQFSPSAHFVKFVAQMLETTQVSQSVVFLSLLYIYRLKVTNPAIRGQEGSEFRLIITALMLANKFLDDNTYTAKTWSDCSGIPLAEINKMEMEFVDGLQWFVHVPSAHYQQWLGVLERLNAARTAGYPSGILSPLSLSPDLAPAAAASAPVPPSRFASDTRARSLSPLRYRPSSAPCPPAPQSSVGPTSSHLLPHPHPHPHLLPPPTAPSPTRPSHKRTPSEAFAYEHERQPYKPAAKRLELAPPAADGTVHYVARPYAPSAPVSPAYAQGEHRLSFPPLGYPSPSQLTKTDQVNWRTGRSLVQPYQYDAALAQRAMQNQLYFYSLAASPLAPVVPPSAAEPRLPARKGVLRLHDPNARPSYVPTYDAPAQTTPPDGASGYAQQQSLQLPPLSLPSLQHLAPGHPSPFANAGAPGYAWTQPLQHQQQQFAYQPQGHGHGAGQYSPALARYAS